MYQAGCNYTVGSYHSTGEILFEFDQVMTPAECLFQTGNYYVDFGWQSADGGACRPFNIWNPNRSDDARGYQKGSMAWVQELFLSEGEAATLWQT